MAVKSAKDRDFLVKSIVRFLAGFGPEYGSVYYFEKCKSVRFRVYSFFASVKDRLYGLECPFCNKRFRRRCTLALHLIRVHYHDILSVAGIE
jgi:hypothetical protein